MHMQFQDPSQQAQFQAQDKLLFTSQAKTQAAVHQLELRRRRRREELYDMKLDDWRGKEKRREGKTEGKTEGRSMEEGNKTTS